MHLSVCKPHTLVFVSVIHGITKFKPDRNCECNQQMFELVTFFSSCNSGVLIEHFNLDTYMNVQSCICIAFKANANVSIPENRFKITS